MRILGGVAVAFLMSIISFALGQDATPKRPPVKKTIIGLPAVSPPDASPLDPDVSPEPEKKSPPRIPSSKKAVSGKPPTLSPAPTPLDPDIAPEPEKKSSSKVTSSKKKTSVAKPPMPSPEVPLTPDRAPEPTAKKVSGKASSVKKGATTKAATPGKNGKKVPEPDEGPMTAKGKVLPKSPAKDADLDDPPAKDLKSSSKSRGKDPDSEDAPIDGYLRRLGGEDNPVVRKRLVMAIMGLKDEARPAIPALLLAASPEEKDFGVRRAAMEAILKFKAVDVVEVLSEAVKDESLDTPQRRMGCKALAVYTFHPSIEPELRETAYKALEAVLADSEPELRLAAATALEAIDRKLSGRQRVVHINLDVDGLKRLRVSSDQALEAVRKAYPKAKVQLLSQGRIIEWVPTDSADTTLLTDFGNLPIYQRPEGAILLRDLARINEAAERKTN